MSLHESAGSLGGADRRGTPARLLGRLRSLGDPDRYGAVAAGACAVHCAATPLILVFLPAIAGAWMSPEVHWITAGVSLPLAGWVLFRGLRRHPSRWITACAILGAAGIIAGLVLPETHVPGAAPAHASDASVAPDVHDHAAHDCSEHGDHDHGAHAHAHDDSGPTEVVECCPTVTLGPDGRFAVHVPPASATTLAGGLLLFSAHVGNLVRRRRAGDCCEEPTGKR